MIPILQTKMTRKDAKLYVPVTMGKVPGVYCSPVYTRRGGPAQETQHVSQGLGVGSALSRLSRHSKQSICL